MQYFAYLQQDGVCDYSIACGNLLELLKATTKESAIAELKGLIHGKYYDDFELSKVTLISGDSEKIPVQEWYKEQKTREGRGKKETRDSR